MILFNVLMLMLAVSFSSQAESEGCYGAFNETKGIEVRAKNKNIESLPLDHPENLRNYFDHTLLKPGASYKDIINLVEEAITYKLKAICVNSCRVHDVAVYLKTRENKDPSSHKPLIVATIGFPLGAVPKIVKVQEAKRAVSSGADELDMVINIGSIKDGQWAELRSEIESVVREGGVPVKVIIETDLLTKQEIQEVSRVSATAGARFVKTSTGFVPNGKGALLKNIQLMKKGIKTARLDETQEPELKASGGIKTLEQAVTFIQTAGVTRLGSSSSVAIMKEAMRKHQEDISTALWLGKKKETN
ncbi:MAG: deoxyribose-phosphate aldolase [Oligoflexia bacterium]|nr:deoxyribose-phosphate aldolase [Oligoflexia bacterium]